MGLATDHSVHIIEHLVPVIRLLLGFFGDDQKVELWLATKNPGLGGYAPMDLILAGRGHKVLKFVEVELGENP